MSEDSRITICIPTYNNPNQLHACLVSLVNNTDFFYDIVVVDNSGGNTTIRHICETISPAIKVIVPGVNLGWMKAINWALKDCKTPYFCLMNDDVVFPASAKNFWKELLFPFFLNNKIGASGPCSNFVAGSQSLFRVETPQIYITSLLIGFCLLTKTSLLREMGGLNEHLPGGDDLDLSIRLTKRGYLLAVNKRAYLHHIGQQTGKRVYGKKWDSDWHSEQTNNALIRLHGVASWYDCFLANWGHFPWGESSSGLVDDGKVETAWKKEIFTRHKGESGINLGCGHEHIEGVLNIDKATSDEEGIGVGGRKRTTVQSDVVADVVHLPFVDSGSVDFLTAFHVLEHLVDPVAAFTEWRRILRPGGVLYIAVPDHGKFNTLLADPSHVHAYNKEALSSLLSALGWEWEVTEAPMALLFMAKPIKKGDVKMGGQIIA